MKRRDTNFSVKCNLRTLRKEARMTLQQVADDTGLAKSTIWELENRRMVPCITNAYKVAQVMGVSVYEVWPDDSEVEEETVTVRRVVRPKS